MNETFMINVVAIFIIGIISYYSVYTVLVDPEIFRFTVRNRVKKLVKMSDLTEFSDGMYNNYKNENENKLSFIKVSSKLKRDLISSGIKLKPEEFVIIWFSITLFPSLIYFIVAGLDLNLFVILIAGLCSPLFILNFNKKRRTKKFSDQLNEALIIIVNSLRTGFTFRHALARVAEDLPNPISEELKRVIREVNYGAKLEYSLGSLAKRMESKELEMINSAIVIQQRTGGNLADIIEKVSDTISDRIKIKNQVRTLTAQGKASGLILALVPVAILISLIFISPDYISVFFENSIGMAFLVISLILEIIGFIIINKLVDIKF